MRVIEFAEQFDVIGEHVTNFGLYVPPIAVGIVPVAPHDFQFDRIVIVIIIIIPDKNTLTRPIAEISEGVVPAAAEADIPSRIARRRRHDHFIFRIDPLGTGERRG